MTEENYNYRTSQKLLRNQFPGKGKLKIPIIPKFQESPGDFDDLMVSSLPMHWGRSVLMWRSLLWTLPQTLRL